MIIDGMLMRLSLVLWHERSNRSIARLEVLLHDNESCVPAPGWCKKAMRSPWCIMGHMLKSGAQLGDSSGNQFISSH